MAWEIWSLEVGVEGGRLVGGSIGGERIGDGVDLHKWCRESGGWRWVLRVVD